MNTKKKIVILKKKTIANNNNQLAQHICIKADNLRKLGFSGDLEAWMNDPNNQYVGRKGRIWITDPVTKTKKIFHYNKDKDTKWGNPFKVAKAGEAPKPNLIDPVKGTYTLNEALGLYREYLDTNGLINDISELKSKNLGCFCPQDSPCHAKILADLANTM